MGTYLGFGAETLAIRTSGLQELIGKDLEILR